MKSLLFGLIQFRRLFAIVLFLNLTAGLSQVGINNTNPDASSILDIYSTDKGVLLPRMTTAQRTAIISPAEGLIVYNTDINCQEVYRNSSWQSSGCFEGDGVQINSNPTLTFLGSGAIELTAGLREIPNFSNSVDYIDKTTFEFSAPVGWYRITVQPIYFKINNTSGVGSSDASLNNLKSGFANAFFALLRVSGSTSQWLAGSTLNAKWEYGLADQTAASASNEQIIYGFSIGGSSIFYNPDETLTYKIGIQGVKDILDNGQTLTIARTLGTANILIEKLY